LQQVIDRYAIEVSPTLKSGDNITKRLKALSKMLPVLRQVSDITAADLSKFRDKRMAEVSVATVRKEMTILRSVFESARRDWSLIYVNPIADVKRPPAPPNRRRLMLDGERDRLLLALGYDGNVETVQHQVAVAMLLGLETAMRAGEMLGLTWDRVNLRGQYASLEKTKNGDYRDVPLSNRAVDLLESMRTLDAHNVFTLTLASLDALFRKARDRCEIKDLHVHDTRATALTNLSSKLDVMELARMVGHRDIRSLMIYYRKSATDLARKLG
jgi:integrase